MANKTIRSRKLVELSNSGYEIVADEPDIRKWKVVNADGKILGHVDELLVDRQLHKVRYIVLNLQGKPLNLLSRKVLIPIGIVQLDGIDDLVILPNVTLEHLATLPDYKRGKLTIGTERKIRNVFSPSGMAVDYDDDVREDVFYQHEHFDDSNLYSGRKKKVSRTAVVNEDYRNHHVSKSELAPFQEGVMEISEKSEAPVVTKEVRVVEEIGVNKTVTERDEKIKDSVRKTEVEIENLDKSH
jgi:hypothetical protein